MAIYACFNYDYINCYNNNTLYRKSCCHFKGDPQPRKIRSNSNSNSDILVSSPFKITRKVRVDSGNLFRSRIPVMVHNLTTTHRHHHLESTLPYKSSKLKAVTLQEPLASADDDDLVLPNQDFSQQAHVPSFEKVLFSLNYFL